MNADDKLEKLKKYLHELGNVVVAFSSGVDSTFLLKVAHDELKDNAIALSASSCSFPKRELDEAIEFCRENRIKHIIVESEELNIEGFKKNPKNRCYLCKKELFEKMLKVAKENNINYVIEGSNIDDEGDYRPGLQTIEELNIKSPLRYAGLSKNDIRILSKKMNLRTWDKQSFACLSSRFPYGEEINEKKLKMVDKAEQFLIDSGFHQLRVRIHENKYIIARIEVEENEFSKLIEKDIKDKIINKFKEIGFDYVSMDLEGYRTGSMNETIDK